MLSRNLLSKFRPMLAGVQGVQSEAIRRFSGEVAVPSEGDVEKTYTEEELATILNEKVGADQTFDE